MGYFVERFNRKGKIVSSKYYKTAIGAVNARQKLINRGASFASTKLVGERGKEYSSHHLRLKHRRAKRSSGFGYGLNFRF